MQHLNRERLLAVLAGRATEAEFTHLDDCHACQQALDQLPDRGDPFQSAVRSAFAEAPLPAVEPSPDRTIIVANRPSPPAFGRVGDYDLLAPIGNGGMGEVFEARQRSVGRDVAVKTITLTRFPPEWHERLRQRFRREQRIAGRLEHANIVRVYDAGEDGGRSFLVMERLHGENLKQLVARQGPLRVADACEIARQMAEGLAAAHAHGVVHRDIKSGNVLLTRDGEVKLLDWGLARDNGHDDLTRPGEIWKSEGYCPPEQLGDFTAVDQRVDIYALGATLFFALTGKLPGGTAATLPSGLPPALADLIRRMLAPDPNGRPSSAGEVARALTNFTHGSDLKALAGHPAALLAALGVRWWDAAASCTRSLDEPGALPMPTGTRVFIEARLNRPAFLYLFWIASDGKFYPLHGWLPGSWQTDPAAKETDRLRVPAYDPTSSPGIELQGAAGTESIVLLAHTTPLTEDISRHFPAPEVFVRVTARLPPDARRPYEWTCRREECVGGLMAPGKPAASANPLEHVQALLRDGLGAHVALIRVLSFANRGY